MISKYHNTRILQYDVQDTIFIAIFKKKKTDEELKKKIILNILNLNYSI